MKYPVVVHQSEYGYDIHCPLLPGCHSQGDTLEEALENIKDAIITYLEIVSELQLDAPPLHQENTLDPRAVGYDEKSAIGENMNGDRGQQVTGILEGKGKEESADKLRDRNRSHEHNPDME